MNMNKLGKIFLVFLVLFTLSSVANASYLNNYYGGYGSYYQPSYSNVFINDNFNKNSNQFSNLNFGQSSLSNSYSTNTNDFFGEGFFNNNYGDFNQNGIVALSDGYSGIKSPCVTKETKFNFPGNQGDGTITEEICDGIELTFFKNNNYQNAINNNFGHNQGNVGANVYQNTFNNDFNQNNFGLNIAKSSGYSFGQSTSFGKGTVLIFN